MRICRKFGLPVFVIGGVCCILFIRSISYEKLFQEQAKPWEQRKTAPALSGLWGAGGGKRGERSGLAQAGLPGGQESFRELMSRAGFLDGAHMGTIFDLTPFNLFTLQYVYLVDPGLGKRVVEKHHGSKKRDLSDALNHALRKLNEKREAGAKGAVEWSLLNFVEGMYRTHPGVGTQYVLLFKHPQTGVFERLNIVRPFAPMRLVRGGFPRRQQAPKQKRATQMQVSVHPLHIVIPLAERIDSFRDFLKRLSSIIGRVQDLHLTVVYFGKEGLKSARSAAAWTAKNYKFPNITVLPARGEEKFSRSRALELGAAHASKEGDVLLFFCDVDVMFTTEFLRRCRQNTQPSMSVYFPIVFSLYNPKLAYGLHKTAEIPSAVVPRFVVSRDTGFWRDFGYGMVCQYASDFRRIGKFGPKLTGWGLEDMHLYESYVKSQMLVIRSTDNSIFHLWHPKSCDPALQKDQYLACIHSRALTEASHAQLGLLAFRDQILKDRKDVL